MRLHQTPEEIIKSASPEQKIMWNNLFLRYGERLSLSPLYYIGIHAGSEFITYKVGTMYVAYSLVPSGTGAAGVTPTLVTLYDESNNVSNYINGQNALFDQTANVNEYAARYTNAENIVFSRAVVQNYTAIKFIGYRLTY